MNYKEAIKLSNELINSNACTSYYNQGFRYVIIIRSMLLISMTIYQMCRCILKTC